MALDDVLEFLHQNICFILSAGVGIQLVSEYQLVLPPSSLIWGRNDDDDDDGDDDDNDNDDGGGDQDDDGDNDDNADYARYLRVSHEGAV